MSVECIVGSNAALQFAHALLNQELLTAPEPEAIIPAAAEKEDIHPVIHKKSLFDRLPSALIRAVPPAAIALQGLFAGVNAVHAQEPTPQATIPGITITCDSDANCIAIVGTQADMYLHNPPLNTGDLANAAVQENLIYPSQAAGCADAFEESNPLWLVPKPDGGRPSFHLPGGTYKLPQDCTIRLFKEDSDVTNAIKPEALSIDPALPVDQKPAGQLSKLFDCLATTGVFSGAFVLWELYIRNKYRDLH